MGGVLGPSDEEQNSELYNFKIVPWNINYKAWIIFNLGRIIGDSFGKLVAGISSDKTHYNFLLDESKD